MRTVTIRECIKISQSLCNDHKQKILFFPIGNLSTNSTRIKTAVFLAALMLLYIVTSAFSRVHLDLARDMRIALDIRDGIEFPLLGPMLASHVQLGSGWYYLLAFLQQLGGGWMGTMLLLAALSSLQFPFAYHAGKAWHSKEAGLLWASLLLLPSWSSFEQITPTHFQLTAATVLATLFCLLRFIQSSRYKYLFISSLGFSLALHAHPSSLILLFPFVGTILAGLHRRIVGPREMLFLALAAALPFAPLVLDQLINGMSLFNQISDYARSEHSSVAIENAPLLVWEIAAGGTRYWLSAMLGVNQYLGWLLAILLGLSVLAGLLGLSIRARRGDRISAFAILALVICLLLLVSMRAVYPYYMTTAYHVGLLGAVSVGLVSIISSAGWRRRTIFLVSILAFCAWIVIWYNAIRWHRDGNWPHAFIPYFDVKSDWQPLHRFATMSARNMKKSGHWLCEHDNLSVHGPYGVHLILHYALEMRFVCPGREISVGGNKSDDKHWFGMPRGMLRNLGVERALDIGGFSLLPVQRVLSDSGRIVKPFLGGYPPLSVRSGSITSWQIFFTPIVGERIAISNLAWVLTPNPEVRVWAGEQELMPTAEDWVTKVYSCTSCKQVSWRIELQSIAPEFVDIVTF